MSAKSKLPEAIGPYRIAVASDHLLFVSGQIGLNPDTGQLVEGGVENQTRQIMENLKAILASEGVSLEQVLKTTIFLTRLEDFGAVNKIYSDYFGQGPFPARSTIAVSALPKGALIEIEAIAKNRS